MTPGPLREAFEQALADDPDDVATHMAYADHLAEQGDPRGEFIQVQLALEDPDLSVAARADLRTRERELLNAHEAGWLGELAAFVTEAGGDHAFRRGWLDALRVRKLTPEYARALVRAPQTRLLRDLTVVNAVPYGEHEYDSLRRLARSTHLINVRRLHLGHVEELDDFRRWEGSDPIGFAAVGLIAAMPRVEEISLWTRGVPMAELFASPLPRLRSLSLHHADERHPLEVLAANPTLQRLATLRFHPHYHGDYCPSEDDTEPEVAYLPLSAVTALIESPNLLALEHLQLRLSSMGDEGVRRIVRSGLLGRLQVLDLRHGCVTDEGARLLAAAPDVCRLRHLGLNRNRLTSAGIDALKGLGIDAHVEDQWGMGNDSGRFGPSYLHEGDFE